ncbi:MAG: hypothetical protein ACOYVD_04235 [Bacillota bacterium]
MNKHLRMLIFCLICATSLSSCGTPKSGEKNSIKVPPAVEVQSTEVISQGKLPSLAKSSELIEITGDYIPLDMADFGIDNTYSYYPRLSGATNLGDNLLIVGAAGQGEFPAITLTLFDLMKNKVIKSLHVAEEGDVYLGLRVTEDKIIVKYLDGFCITDHNLNTLSSKRKIPTHIYADHELRGSVWFFSYDISVDLKTVVYANSEGIYSYNLETDKNTYLVGRLPPARSKADLPKNKYLPPFAPYFINKDEWVVAQVSGYESTSGTVFVPLNKSTEPWLIDSVHPFIWNWPIIGKTLPHLVSLNIMGSGDYAMSIVDGATQKISEPIPIIYTKEQVPKLYSESDMLYNDSYFVYVRQIEDWISDEADAHYTINVVDLTTMTAKTVLTIKGGNPTLLGITNDGRVLVGYNLMQESGLLITSLTP